MLILVPHSTESCSDKVLTWDSITENGPFSGNPCIVSTGFWEKIICVYLSVQAKKWKLPLLKKTIEIDIFFTLSNLNKLQGNETHNMAHWKYTGKVKAKQS